MAVPDPVSRLSSILKPKSIAVIGASTSPDKLGHEIMKNILDSGFQGAVYPINPKETEILGRPAYARLTDVPGDVDFAVIDLQTDSKVRRLPSGAITSTSSPLPMSCTWSKGMCCAA